MTSPAGPSPATPPARTVLATGGAGALGRSVVRRFLREGHRVHVPLRGTGEESALRQAVAEALDGPTPGSLELHAGVDLTRPESVTRLFAEVRERSGPPLVLLNLAGGFSAAPFEATAPEAWRDLWDRNATTVFLCARAALPEMRAAGWGRILNVSAFPAIDRGGSDLSAYGAAKAAVLNLTQTLARETVGSGITANAILPSIIDTPANRSAMPDADRDRWLPAEAIADVLHFLASDEARIVTGAAVPLTLG